MDTELNIRRRVGAAGRQARDFLSCLLATCLALLHLVVVALLLPCRRAYESNPACSDFAAHRPRPEYNPYVRSATSEVTLRDGDRRDWRARRRRANDDDAELSSWELRTYQVRPLYHVAPK